jgi:hypothetical protein
MSGGIVVEHESELNFYQQALLRGDDYCLVQELWRHRCLQLHLNLGTVYVFKMTKVKMA